MKEEKTQKLAKTVYKTLCEMLDDRKWHYRKDEENLTISCDVQGDDLPMEIRVVVDAKRQLAIVYSPMSFVVPESRRAAIAVAVSRANYKMVDGSFDYDYVNGKILFRLTSSWRDSLIGKEMFAYMLQCSCATVDNYNDKFLAVAKQDMSVDEVVKFVE